MKVIIHSYFPSFLFSFFPCSVLYLLVLFWFLPDRSTLSEFRFPAALYRHLVVQVRTATRPKVSGAAGTQCVAFTENTHPNMSFVTHSIRLLTYIYMNT